MVRNIDRKLKSKWYQKGIKIEALGVQGKTFENFMDFGKPISFMSFDVLGNWQKAAQQIQKIRFLVTRAGPWRRKDETVREFHNPGWTTELRFWPFWLILHPYLTTPDTGRCRQICGAHCICSDPKIDCFA